jgi:hypothetical protein
MDTTTLMGPWTILWEYVQSQEHPLAEGLDG